VSQLRYIAARLINEVTSGRSLSDYLEAAILPLKDPRDRAFVQAVCYGVCRFYPRLDVILSQLLEKPMKAKDSDVHALLMVGLYQLIDMRVPAHAAVAETVSATEKFKKSWARGLVNAVLRGYLREREKLEKEIAQDEEAQYMHPIWWVTALKKAWPAQWQAILTANNQHPPFALRVNQQKITREEYLKKVNAQIIAETANGIILESAIAVESLPGFAQGEISVQDGAAQLAAELLMLAPGQRVLDACAAPGGKLTHILEIQPQLAEVIAVEKEASRLAAIKENLSRLNLQAKILCLDVAEVKPDGGLFDRILLDAPCSASGVVRRHPDIKLLRQSSDILELAKEQLRLLTALWPLLKPGGLLLYATCSIFPEENSQIIQHFLAAHPEAEAVPLQVNWGIACSVGRQILPGMHQMDGFYYACLRKS
jgi:16S rRNA (cytosine967-C5)-methyltransferase